MKEQFLQKVTLECPSKPLLIQMILVLNTSQIYLQVAGKFS